MSTLDMEFVNGTIENAELVLNYVTGYMLCKERELIRDHKDLNSVKKLKEVFKKIMIFEAEQNRKEEEEEEEEEEEDREEKEQRMWVAECVQEMVTDYQYESRTHERETQRVAERAVQVNMSFMF